MVAHFGKPLLTLRWKIGTKVVIESCRGRVCIMRERGKGNCPRDVVTEWLHYGVEGGGGGKGWGGCFIIG